MPNTLYLDANATTRVLPEAQEAAARAMGEHYGNPSSSHSCGLVAKEVLEHTRSAAREVLGVVDGQIAFTSGATEGIQTAVLSALCAARQSKAGHLLVYGATEHKAVPQALAHWNAVLGLGFELRALPVDAQGQHDLQLLAAWLPETALLCTMAANNETGVVSDLAGIEAQLRQRGDKALWLVDGVQALGKLDMHLQATRIDYAVFSGHKLYAPKGVGLLYVRRGAPFTPLLAGGQEDGMRGGTENVPGIAALGAVLQALLRGDTFAPAETLRAYRDRLEQSLRAAVPSIVFNAPLENSLPTTLNFSVPGLAGKTLLDMFDAAGLRLSAGSACNSANSAGSHVLTAMGLGSERTGSAVRLSIGALTTALQIEQACAAIARCAAALPREPVAPSNIPLVAGAAPTLLWCELKEFLAQHPQAQLVDLRETCEQEVAVVPNGGCSAVSAPMSSLDRLAPQWLRETPSQPRVLVCRSGKRSQQAALWLQSLGLKQTWHLHGGLALRPASWP